ncbi:hypothetical protein ACGFMK_01060 [Amycolatopsis sp. NPDC049252]|uniref:hypothetical protein n=1 Tax=Amycolatopsis sp. NPDC049252 TaxID=3363933 RepID=UPI003723BAA2
MRMNSRAWSGRFDAVPWAEIATWFHELAAEHAEFRPMTDIVTSVLARGGDRHLVALTAMHDLVVTSRPVPADRPIEVVVVRSPAPGHLDADAVPQFWRLVREKFGVEPVRQP